MRTIRRSILIILLSMFGLLAVACQSEPQPQATPASGPAAPTDAGGTNPTAITSSAPLQIPTAAPGKAVVHGVVLSADTKQPLTDADGVDVFLAEIIYSDDKTQRLAGLDKTTAPRVDVDQRGAFVFADVEPGEYALAVRGPLNEVLGRKADNLDQDYIFTITANQTLDLGEIYAKIQ